MIRIPVSWIRRSLSQPCVIISNNLSVCRVVGSPFHTVGGVCVCVGGGGVGEGQSTELPPPPRSPPSPVCDIGSSLFEYRGGGGVALAVGHAIIFAKMSYLWIFAEKTKKHVSTTFCGNFFPQDVSKKDAISPEL